MSESAAELRTSALNDDVRAYWEAEPCGTGAATR